MIIKSVTDKDSFTAGDGCRLCELIHPCHHDREVGIGYSIAYGSIKPGQATRPHLLKTSSEIYYILNGKGIIRVNDESAVLRPHQAVYVPPGAVQMVTNTGDVELTFLCIVEPAWHQDDEEIIDRMPDLVK